MLDCFCNAPYAGTNQAKGIVVPLFFFTVEQQERAIVERFGKFVRVGGPGLQTKTPFVERVAGRMSLQVEQLNSEIETKTKDNVFVRVKLAVQYQVGASEQQVKDAMNNINAAQRNQVAAAAQGDAQKTLAVKKAEGERETMRLQGEGVAAERKAIAEGLRESLEIIAEQGLDPREAMALVALTQYTDMIRALGEGAKTNTILLPHSPGGVGDLMTQIRDGVLVGDLASDSAGRPANSSSAALPRPQAPSSQRPR